MSKMLPGIILIIGVGVIIYLAPWLSRFFTTGSLANFGLNASVFYLSNDAGFSFQSQSNGLMINEIFDVAFSPDQSMYLSTSQGVFKFDGVEQEWKRIKDDAGIFNFPSEARSLVWRETGDVLLAINKNGRGKIYYSSDNFKNLAEVYVTSQADSAIKDLKISVFGRIYFLSSERILGYSDDGKTFRLLSHLNKDFERIVMDQKNNGIIYLWGKSAIYKSVDGGHNFFDLGVSLFGINDLFANDNGVIYLATGKGVFQSFDGGWSWIVMDSLLPKNLPAGAVSYNNEKEFILAGFDGRLYISEDGAGWSVKTIGANSINMIRINPFNSNEILVGMKK